ncbi:MAG: addiction module protein [Undibacterium sp.]|nr:addiction module protein [Undibacterium sp.]
MLIFALHWYKGGTDFGDALYLALSAKESKFNTLDKAFINTEKQLQVHPKVSASRVDCLVNQSILTLSLPQKIVIPQMLKAIYTPIMPISTITAEYMKLSVAERILLVEDIWDSIAEQEADAAVGLSQDQKTELHRRVAAHRADPSTAVPWDQVRSKLFSSKL